MADFDILLTVTLRHKIRAIDAPAAVTIAQQRADTWTTYDLVERALDCSVDDVYLDGLPMPEPAAAARAMLAVLKGIDAKLTEQMEAIDNPMLDEPTRTEWRKVRAVIEQAEAAGVTLPKPECEITLQTKVRWSGRPLPIVLADFLDVNSDARLDHERILSDLRATGTYTGGGGAEPGWSLSVAQED